MSKKPTPMRALGSLVGVLFKGLVATLWAGLMSLIPAFRERLADVVTDIDDSVESDKRLLKAPDMPMVDPLHPKYLSYSNHISLITRMDSDK